MLLQYSVPEYRLSWQFLPTLGTEHEKKKKWNVFDSFNLHLKICITICKTRLAECGDIKIYKKLGSCLCLECYY